MNNDNSLETMKNQLITTVQGQMNNLERVDAKELGEVVDVIKDLAEAVYYCEIVNAMREKQEQPVMYYAPEYRNAPPYENDYNRMYYNGGGSSSSGGNSGGSSGNYARGGNSSRNYTEMEYPIMNMRDAREGRSASYRRNYMESKEMHQPKTMQMKELEKYIQELSSDIVEMIQDASPEEKALLEKKMTALTNKVSQMQ